MSAAQPNGAQLADLTEHPLSDHTPRTVFFATIAAGGGHVATATAMAQALQHHYPGEFEVRVSDVMAEFGATALDKRHKASWRTMLARPKLVRWGQRATDAAPALIRASQSLLLGRFARTLAAELNRIDPQLVVANHGWLATVFAQARRFGLRAPVVIFATEPFDASALWSEPRSETVVAPSMAAKEDLVRLGVPAERVWVRGYPVKREFLEPPSREAARAKLGIGAGFTYLLSLGAEGMAGEALARAEQLAGSGAQVLAVAGRNRDLEAALSKLALRYPKLSPFGFTAEMPTLLAAADVVVGKAGPASTMEALAVGRPVIATSYVGLNELAVMRFLVANDLGSFAPDGGSLELQLAGWRNDAGRRAAAAAHASELDFAGMTQRIATFLARQIVGVSPPPAPPTGAFESVDRAALERTRVSS